MLLGPHIQARHPISPGSASAVEMIKATVLCTEVWNLVLPHHYLVHVQKFTVTTSWEHRRGKEAANLVLNPEHQGFAKDRQFCALLLFTGSGSLWDAKGVVTTASPWSSSVPWSDIGSWGWRVTLNLILK